MVCTYYTLQLNKNTLGFFLLIFVFVDPKIRKKLPILAIDNLVENRLNETLFKKHTENICLKILIL